MLVNVRLIFFSWVSIFNEFWAHSDCFLFYFWDKFVNILILDLKDNKSMKNIAQRDKEEKTI